MCGLVILILWVQLHLVELSLCVAGAGQDKLVAIADLIALDLVLLDRLLSSVLL